MKCDYCGSKLKPEPEMTEHWWYCPHCGTPYFVEELETYEIPEI